MNKKPVHYWQTDKRWKGLPYQAPGETATIGGSGCGPTCAAMLIQTLTGKVVTPADTCRWSVEHGYKAPNQGTYYGYFKRQFEAYGIACDRINFSSLYGNPGSLYHEQAVAMLRQGYYIIACMGKGLWTRSGHFVVVWWADGKIHINDPASHRAERNLGDPDLFFKQVKFYFWVDARDYNKEDDDMTDEEFEQHYIRMRQKHQDNDCGDWSREARDWAVNTGLIAGGTPLPDGQPNYMWQDSVTREQVTQMFFRYNKMEDQK